MVCEFVVFSIEFVASFFGGMNDDVQVTLKSVFCSHWESYISSCDYSTQLSHPSDRFPFPFFKHQKIGMKQLACVCVQFRFRSHLAHCAIIVSFSVATRRSVVYYSSNFGHFALEIQVHLNFSNGKPLPLLYCCGIMLASYAHPDTKVINCSVACDHKICLLECAFVFRSRLCSSPLSHINKYYCRGHIHSSSCSRIYSGAVASGSCYQRRIHFIDHREISLSHTHSPSLSSPQNPHCTLELGSPDCVCGVYSQARIANPKRTDWLPCHAQCRMLMHVIVAFMWKFRCSFVPFVACEEDITAAKNYYTLVNITLRLHNVHRVEIAKKWKFSLRRRLINKVEMNFCSRWPWPWPHHIHIHHIAGAHYYYLGRFELMGQTPIWFMLSDVRTHFFPS